MANPTSGNSHISASLRKGFVGLDLVPSHVPITVATLKKHRDPDADL